MGQAQLIVPAFVGQEELSSVLSPAGLLAPPVGTSPAWLSPWLPTSVHETPRESSVVGTGRFREPSGETRGRKHGRGGTEVTEAGRDELAGGDGRKHLQQGRAAAPPMALRALL